jgi:hypothetical protein
VCGGMPRRRAKRKQGKVPWPQTASQAMTVPER